MTCCVVAAAASKPTITRGNSFGGRKAANKAAIIVAPARRNRSVVAVRATSSSSSDNEQTSSPSPPPSMFRRIALALGLASVASTSSPSPSCAESSSSVPADLPQTEDEWRAKLSPESFYVLRNHGTERPFTSPLNKEKRKGTFVCAGCGSKLFSSSAKYDSGTGWPSYFQPISADAVVESVDKSVPFMPRVEISCARCRGHLGHVFPDGPRPTGLRYCMNGVSLAFVADEEA